VQRKTHNNLCRAELGQYPLLLKILKSSIKFYNHLKSVNPQTYHHKAITYLELKAEESPLSLLVRRLSAGTGPQQDSNANSSRPNQIINKQKENYIEFWKETTKTQSKSQCYLT